MINKRKPVNAPHPERPTGPCSCGAADPWQQFGHGEWRCVVCCGLPQKRKPGRPKTDDPRTPRVKMNDAEWWHCRRAARKAGAKSTAAWVRQRCGL